MESNMQTNEPVGNPEITEIKMRTVEIKTVIALKNGEDVLKEASYISEAGIGPDVKEQDYKHVIKPCLQQLFGELNSKERLDEISAKLL